MINEQVEAQADTYRKYEYFPSIIANKKREKAIKELCSEYKKAVSAIDKKRMVFDIMKVRRKQAEEKSTQKDVECDECRKSFIPKPNRSKETCEKCISRYLKGGTEP